LVREKKVFLKNHFSWECFFKKNWFHVTFSILWFKINYFNRKRTKHELNNFNGKKYPPISHSKDRYWSNEVTPFKIRVWTSFNIPCWITKILIQTTEIVLVAKNMNWIIYVAKIPIEFSWRKKMSTKWKNIHPKIII